MIGNGYWATGIIVRYGWSARVEFFDDGFCSDDTDSGTISTEGTLKTRYYIREGDGADADGLAVAVDAVKTDTDRLGIRFWTAPPLSLHVYYEGDGEHEDWPPPAGWRELVDAQSIRLGWEGLYVRA